MLVQNLIQNLPAILGFLIGFSWLIYTGFLRRYKLDLIQILVNWFYTKKVVVPALATLVLPFLFTYFYQEIPGLIDRWKLRDFVGILGAIVGAILGFLISQFSQWKTQAQQISSVRKMLNLEINQNLRLLAEFKNKANDVSSDYPNDFIIKNFFTPYDDRVWRSQVLLLPIALNDEEINQIYVFYMKMDKIVRKYNFINGLVSELNEIGMIQVGGGVWLSETMIKVEKRDNLIKEVKTEWKELNKMMTELINNNVVINLLQ
ncbi:MAG: hypothetical protein V7L04_18695 [Nostoc sp.]|uniref:hypothetical protein n=1 Tax=Nostoc sp. TaxID=1180 RepID=UPI002FF8D206